VRPEKLSGHSLASMNARPPKVTRHKNLPVLHRYIRSATAFDDVGEVL